MSGGGVGSGVGSGVGGGDVQAGPDRAKSGPGDEGDRRVRRLELVISYVLRIGVVVSVAVILAGLVLSFVRHPGYSGTIDYHSVAGPGYHFPDTFAAVAHSIASGGGRGFIMLGLALLVLTPVMRVAVSVFGFIFEKDPPMVAVTIFVLAVLIGSLAIGVASR